MIQYIIFPNPIYCPLSHFIKSKKCDSGAGNVGLKKITLLFLLELEVVNIKLRSHQTVCNFINE